MGDLKSFFNQGYLNKLERFTVHYSQKAGTGYRGIRKSNDKGRSMDFSDFRDYSPGDDIQRIDWNSYGRLNKLLVKLFEEEKQICVNVFLDISKSMDYGQKNKLFHGKVTALSLLYMAAAKSDKVNLFVFSDNLYPVNIQLSDKNMLNKGIEVMENIQGEKDSDFKKVSSAINKTKLTPGKAFLISDFLNDGTDSLIKSLRMNRQETVLIHILSQEEIEPDFSGEIRLIDSENGNTADIEANEGVISAYKRFVLDFISEIERFCVKERVLYIHQISGENIFDILKRIDSGA